MSDFDLQSIIPEDSFVKMVHEKDLLSIPLQERPNIALSLLVAEEEFLDFAKKNAAQVFYYYEYPDITEILINGDTFDGAKGELKQLISDLQISADFAWYLDDAVFPQSSGAEADDCDYDPLFSDFEENLRDIIIAHNETVNVSQYHTPYFFAAVCLMQGNVVGISRESEQPMITVAEDDLYNILSKFKGKAKQLKEAQRKETSEIRERLKAELVKNNDFRHSTNMRLRQSFGTQLWEDENYSWIKKGFSDGWGAFPPKEFFLFLDRVYNEIKTSRW